ncbi:MAG: nucleotidyltransferase family protein [Clostridiales bacterium]|nr:nucleotidyltransferase family protein [Clostridiales bacterium]
MAAGSGRRFGANKLLAPVEGVPMICRAMDSLPPALFARAVAVSCHPEVLALAGRAGYECVENPWAAEGQSASIRLGVRALREMDGILFAVGDQPWLTRRSVERLRSAFAARPDCIAALSWNGARGNPVIFPADLFPELMALRGDVGGGQVLRRHPDRLLLVEAGAEQELRDVDTPEALK